MASSSQLRAWWAPYRCDKTMHTNILFYGRHIGGVATPAVDAFAALEQTLKATGYSPTSRWAYNCRKIAGTDKWSLHAYAIAIDIDPFGHGNPFVGGGLDWTKTKFTPEQVDAVYEIRNLQGERIWAWGGYWSTKQDYMHWQLDRPPGRVEVDWDTVPDWDGTEPEEIMALLPIQYGDGYTTPPADAALTGDRSAKKEDVKIVQDLAGATVDGIYGHGTAAAVGNALGAGGEVLVVGQAEYRALGGYGTLTVETVEVVKGVTVT